MNPYFSYFFRYYRLSIHLPIMNWKWSFHLGNSKSNETLSCKKLYYLIVKTMLPLFADCFFQKPGPPLCTTLSSSSKTDDIFPNIPTEHLHLSDSQRDLSTLIPMSLPPLRILSSLGDKARQVTWLWWLSSLWERWHHTRTLHYTTQWPN